MQATVNAHKLAFWPEYVSILQATARQEDSLESRSLPQIWLHRSTKCSLHRLCDRASQTAVFGVLLGRLWAATWVLLSGWLFLRRWRVKQSNKPGNRKWRLEPKHAQPSLTGPGKIAFNQSMGWVGPDDCNICCDGFSFVDVTEAHQASAWICWGDWQFLSLRVCPVRSGLVFALIVVRVWDGTSGSVWWDLCFQRVVQPNVKHHDYASSLASL